MEIETTKNTAAKAIAFSRYKKAYGCSDAECEELYLFDSKYCGSDATTKKYLEERCGMTEKAVGDLFYRSAALDPEVTAVPKEVAAKTKEDQLARLEFLAQQLTGEYGFLFGDLIDRTSSTLTFELPGGKTADIKIMKHKTEQVVSKDVKRRGIAKDARGHALPTRATDNELRCMAVENVIRENSELFIAPSAAGSRYGFAMFNKKYPFGSVKLTHHK